MKLFISILFINLLFLSCNTKQFNEGAFSDTERIAVYSSSATSLQWESSIRDYEVVVYISDSNISIVNNSLIPSGNSRYWRLSFGVSGNGSINPSTDLSNTITSYVTSGLPGGSPRYWIVYSFDKNGNLIRSSLVYTFT